MFPVPVPMSMMRHHVEDWPFSSSLAKRWRRPTNHQWDFSASASAANAAFSTRYPPRISRIRPDEQCCSDSHVQRARRRSTCPLRGPAPRKRRYSHCWCAESRSQRSDPPNASAIGPVGCQSPSRASQASSEVENEPLPSLAEISSSPRRNLKRCGNLRQKSTRSLSRKTAGVSSETIMAARSTLARMLSFRQIW